MKGDIHKIPHRKGKVWVTIKDGRIIIASDIAVCSIYVPNCQSAEELLMRIWCELPDVEPKK